LKSDGTVWDWGYNNFGQLGNGNTSNQSTPVQVTDLTGVVAVAGGYYHSIALKNSGTVWDWGYNNYGQLGNGNTSNQSTPVQVSGLTGAAAVSGGRYHTVALRDVSTATITASATGSPAPTYQWYNGSVLIPGATGASYSTGLSGTYTCVATNHCGSATSNSSALTAASCTQAVTVAAARALSVGTTLELPAGPVVTRSLGDFLYVEDSSRAAGIMVLPDPVAAVAEGSVVTIIGTLDTLAGELVIDNAYVTATVAGAIPNALGMIGRSANTNLAQGLLVRLWGAATVPLGATDAFSVDDGSCALGVKLYGVALPPDGAMVCVTGVLGHDVSGPIVRVNHPSDLLVIGTHSGP
jgi:hypothetical protein